jgi:hypothetical protein
MTTHWIFTLVLIIILNSCNAQDNNLKEKSIILTNQSIALSDFAKNADIIDSDTESYWAYEYTDSILSSIDLSGKTYVKDLNKIYSAYTHIFYGMSYTRSILAISRGDNYSLEELNRTIVQPSTKEIVDYHNLAKNELSSIYSMINFYKVSRMPRYNDMYTLFQNDSLENENTFKNYSAETAYRIVSLENKKLFFKSFVGLIIDIYSINNQNAEESDYNKYMQGLVKLGEEMDKIPSSYDAILNLSEQEYYEHILKSSEVQKSMLNLLVTEIKTLKQRNE